MRITKGVFYFLMFCSTTAFAQINIVTAFSGTQLNQTVYLAFTLSSGQTCNGINIERSNDSINFYKIGDIAGTCGSATTPVSYTYTDTFPIINANNYYRLLPGNNDWSMVIKVYFKAQSESEFLIAPNPFTTATNISFKNASHKTLQWQLFDANGKQVSHGATKEESFIILKSNLNAGLYLLYLLLDNKDLQKARLVVE